MEIAPIIRESIQHRVFIPLTLERGTAYWCYLKMIKDEDKTMCW
jgi:hypothetical protein